LEQLLDTIRFSTIFLQIVIIILFLKSNAKREERNIAVLFVFGVLSYLVADWNSLEDYPGILIPAIICTFTLTYSFWLFSKSLFDDDFVCDKRYIKGLVIVVALEALLVFGGLNWLNENSPARTFADL